MDPHQINRVECAGVKNLNLKACRSEEAFDGDAVAVTERLGRPKQLWMDDSERESEQQSINGTRLVQDVLNLGLARQSSVANR